MDQQEICEDCHQKHNCQEIYEKLGKTKGRSVVFKVLIAFLLPILVFIGFLAGFEGIWGEAIKLNKLQIILNFLLALLLTGVCVLIIRAINECVAKNE